MVEKEEKEEKDDGRLCFWRPAVAVRCFCALEGDVFWFGMFQVAIL